jgi:ABC-2 type transport system permease protein
VERWVVLVSFFNLAVVALLLSTFTTRFIFPLISLEGRRFWVLGTAPISRGTILWSKFWFACGGAVPSCGALVLISDVTLRIPQQSLTVVWIHQLACFILCVGLSALAVGLGARLPSLRETSPSRIAAGFGGTLNLVLSSLFIIAVMLLTAVPCFFWAQKGGPGPLPESPFFGGWIGLGSAGSVAVGVALCLALGVVTTVVPLRLGLRAFSRLEF